MCSGWGDHYDDPTVYWGNNESDISRFHFPGFEAEGVQWLIDERRTVGLAVDTPSIDHGQSKHLQSHVKFCSHNLFGLENVKSTCELPPKGAMAYVFPIKTESGSGGPTRDLAVWGDELTRVVVPASVTGSAWRVRQVPEWIVFGMALVIFFM